MEIRTQTRVANKVTIDLSRRSRSGARGAFGRVAIGALSIKKGRIKRLDIEELEVGRLRVTELVVEQERRPGAP